MRLDNAPALPKDGLRGVHRRRIIAGAMKVCPSSSRNRRQSFLALAVVAAFPLCSYPQQRALRDAAAHPSDTAAGGIADWLNQLAWAESGNRERLVHRDRDGQLYYGCLQFQARTFRAYVKKFHLLPADGRSELMRRIYDCAFQKRLAAMMIRSDPNAWKHWKLTVEQKIGLPPSDESDETSAP